MEEEKQPDKLEVYRRTVEAMGGAATAKDAIAKAMIEWSKGKDGIVVSDGDDEANKWLFAPGSEEVRFSYGKLGPFAVSYHVALTELDQMDPLV